MSEYGVRLALSGQWRRGEQLLEEALARNPGNAGYYHGVLALTAHMLKNDDQAMAHIRQADLAAVPFFHLIDAVIDAEVGLAGEAAAEADIFAKLRPDFPQNVRAELEKRNILPQDQVVMMAAMRRAGVSLPPDASEPSSPP